MLKAIAILLSVIYTYNVASAQISNKTNNPQINTNTPSSETTTLKPKTFSAFHEQLNAKKKQAQEKIHILSKNQLQKNKHTRQEQNEDIKQFRQLHNEQIKKKQEEKEEKEAKLKEITNTSNDETPKNIDVLAF